MRLPFEDASFDGVAAASSIEQTPGPEAALKELHRVLKPGGTLRMHYESLGPYRDGREREVWLGNFDPGSRLTVYDRDVEGETAHHYQLVFDTSAAEVKAVFSRESGRLSYATMTPKVLNALCEHLTEATTWTTRHPSCRTYLSWLKEIGFR